jgi:hypothetical protein
VAGHPYVGQGRRVIPELFFQRRFAPSASSGACSLTPAFRALPLSQRAGRTRPG